MMALRRPSSDDARLTAENYLSEQLMPYLAAIRARYRLLALLIALVTLHLLAALIALIGSQLNFDRGWNNNQEAYLDGKVKVCMLRSMFYFLS